MMKRRGNVRSERDDSEGAQLAALRRQVAEQRETIDGIQARIDSGEFDRETREARIKLAEVKEQLRSAIAIIDQRASLEAAAIAKEPVGRSDDDLVRLYSAAVMESWQSDPADRHLTGLRAVARALGLEVE